MGKGEPTRKCYLDVRSSVQTRRRWSDRFITSARRQKSNIDGSLENLLKNSNLSFLSLVNAAEQNIQQRFTSATGQSFGILPSGRVRDSGSDGRNKKWI